MKINFSNAAFCTSCFDVNKLNVEKRPEIVLVGRSNVGKSSMINTLLNKKALARVGATPGKTVSVNFYDVDRKIWFTDLPGYGYAKRSKEQRRGWGGLIGEYLDAGRDVRLILFLVDSRHEPTEDDLLMYRYLMSRETLFCVVATKTDKLGAGELKKNLERISERFGVSAVAFSAKSGAGAETLRHIIEDVSSAEGEEI